VVIGYLFDESFLGHLPRFQGGLKPAPFATNVQDWLWPSAIENGYFKLYVASMTFSKDGSDEYCTCSRPSKSTSSDFDKFQLSKIPFEPANALAKKAAGHECGSEKRSQH